MQNIEKHTHNGLDSPQIEVNDVVGGLSSSDVVLLTTAQSVAGIKTFSSIPVLPASDPTTDNQAVRKAYIDGLLETVASDDLIDSADTQRETDSLTYVKLKEIKFNEVDGVVRVKFDMRIDGSTLKAYGKIYKNGVEHGTEREDSDNVFTTYSEDLAFSTDDLIQLYVHKDNGGSTAQVEKFRLYYDKIFKTTAGTVNTD